MLCESVKIIIFAASLSVSFMNYHPQPLDIDKFSIPEQLVEKIARDVHEQWTHERQQQGWVWGERRDDERKEHPGLVPYDKLTDEEKEVDRATVRTVISSLLESGATIMINDCKDNN